MKPAIHYITANVVQYDEFTTYVDPFRGVAFVSPASGQWCDLRTGCTLAPFVGDEVVILSQRPVRDSWQPGLAARLPRWTASAPKSAAIAQFAA